MGDLWIPQQRRGVVLFWGDLWVLQKRRGMLLVGETREYHSRGEEYGVILERPVGTTADWRGMVLAQGKPVSTAS